MFKDNSTHLDTVNNIVDLYIRVSTTEQAEEGYSVGEQEARLRAYCEAYGYTIHAIHIDPGISGATLDRPGIRKVINDVRNRKISKVIVWKLDRLSRSQKDTLILLEDVFIPNNCDFISLMESFDTSSAIGRCIVGILAAFSQMERENIKMRTTMGRQARIRQGHFHGSHCPIGYNFKPHSNDLDINPYTANMVKDVYKRFLSGESISSIARAMDAKYGSSSFDWKHNTAVRRVLSNPVYMGKVQIKGTYFQGIHKALVSEADWYAASALHAHNKALHKRTFHYKTANGSAADHLLTGLLFCGDCGARMYARRVSKTNKKYVCHSVARTSDAMIKSDNCTNRLHPYTVADLDSIIINEIMKLSLDRTYFDDMLNEISDETDDNISTQDIIKEKLEDTDKQIDRLLNLYQTGLIDITDIQIRLGELQKERKLLEGQLESEKVKPAPDIEKTWDTLSTFSDILENGAAEDIHNIIHSLIDKIVVLNEEITIYWSFS